MAALKLFVLFFVVVLATSTQIPNSPPLKGAIDDAQALLNTLTGVLKTAVSSSVLTIDGLVESLLGKAADIGGSVKSSLDGVVSGLVHQVDGLVEKAAAAGVDATVCVGSTVADLTALPVPVLSQVTGCLSGKVSAAQSLVDDYINKIQGTVSVVANYNAEIIGCASQGFFAPICIVPVIAKITSSIASLPLQITGYVGDVTRTVTSAVAGLAGCEVGVVAGVTQSGGSIVAKVGDCVNNLINGTRVI